MAMTTIRSFPHPVSSSSSNSRTLSKTDCASSDTFPAGLRVLVVDDDPICLLILDRMLRRCQYQVTTCGRATEALVMLRENRDSFDVIISDVYMPDMDGFKLLELVGLEMDLPVIMMSANGETSTVMKGIKHGACDYLLKPVRMEELRNIWQHVVRKKWRRSTQRLSYDDDTSRQVADDGDHNSSANEGYDGSWKQGKKRKDSKEEEDDVDLDPDDPSTTKKPRVVWSVELHQQFVNAVNQFGIDKAVPKRILEVMNVQGLTRENVASHLQKYRLYLKRISGVAHQSGALNPSFPAADYNFGPAGLPGLGTLSGSNELPSQALLSSLQAGVLGRLGQANNLGIVNMDKANLSQIAALQGAGSGAPRSPFLPSFNSSLLNGQGTFQAGPLDGNLLQTSQLGTFPGVIHGKAPSELSALQHQQLEAAAGLGHVNNSIHPVNPNANALLMRALQEHQVAEQLMSKGGLALPTGGGNAGQQQLSTDAGVWATSLSSLNSAGSSIAPQYSDLLRLRSMPPLVGSSVPGRMTDLGSKGQQGLSTDAGMWGASIRNLNASGSINSAISGQSGGFLGLESVPGMSSDQVIPSLLERAIDVESKGLCTSNTRVVSSLTVSPPVALTGQPDELLFSRLRDMDTSSSSSLNEGLPQRLGSDFTGLKEALHTSQKTQRAWQLSQEYGQVLNEASQSPSFSRGFSSAQNLNILVGQERGELRGLGFSNNLNTDSDSMKAAQTEQLRAASSMNIDGEGGPGWLAEPDELLSIVLKQQQEGLGLTESELGGANGYALNNLYGK